MLDDNAHRRAAGRACWCTGRGVCAVAAFPGVHTRDECNSDALPVVTAFFGVVPYRALRVGGLMATTLAAGSRFATPE
jgi:hypothetical protein